MIAVARTFIVCALLAGLAILGYQQITTSQQQKVIAELNALNEEMEQRLEARQAMIDRLSRSRRLAHVQVIDQRQSDDGTVAETQVLFIELDESGVELARQTFMIPGDVLFVDAWCIKFDHEHVAMGHPLFGRTLVLLRRIYSDRMAPIDGFLIDTPGAIPPAYAAGEPGRFEQRLWEQFWQIACDADLARSMGVRVAQGEAVYKPVSTGRTYELIVDADGGMSLAPLVKSPP